MSRRCKSHAPSLEPQLLFVCAAALSLAAARTQAGEAVSVPTAFKGHVLVINGQDQPLGQAQWDDPERNWRTVGELLKTALPPGDAAGKRPEAKLTVALDQAATWGGLKCLLMAASALGVEQAEVHIPVRPRGNVVRLELPGADASSGQVVAVPLFTGGATGIQTEAGGQRAPCTLKLFQDLVAQCPKATVNVQAGPTLPAYLVVAVLRDLHLAGAAKVAFLPLKHMTPEETAERKEAKDAVDKALRGPLGGLGK